jgi:hypothetical protein
MGSDVPAARGRRHARHSGATAAAAAVCAWRERVEPHSAGGALGGQESLRLCCQRCSHRCCWHAVLWRGVLCSRVCSCAAYVPLLTCAYVATTHEQAPPSSLHWGLDACWTPRACPDSIPRACRGGLQQLAAAAVGCARGPAVRLARQLAAAAAAVRCGATGQDRAGQRRRRHARRCAHSTAWRPSRAAAWSAAESCSPHGARGRVCGRGVCVCVALHDASRACCQFRVAQWRHSVAQHRIKRLRAHTLASVGAGTPHANPPVLGRHGTVGSPHEPRARCGRHPAACGEARPFTPIQPPSQLMVCSAACVAALGSWGGCCHRDAGGGGQQGVWGWSGSLWASRQLQLRLCWWCAAHGCGFVAPAAACVPPPALTTPYEPAGLDGSPSGCRSARACCCWSAA